MIERTTIITPQIKKRYTLALITHRFLTGSGTDQRKIKQSNDLKQKSTKPIIFIATAEPEGCSSVQKALRLSIFIKLCLSRRARKRLLVYSIYTYYRYNHDGFCVTERKAKENRVQQDLISVLWPNQFKNTYQATQRVTPVRLAKRM